MVPTEVQILQGKVDSSGICTDMSFSVPSCLHLILYNVILHQKSSFYRSTCTFKLNRSLTRRKNWWWQTVS